VLTLSGATLRITRPRADRRGEVVPGVLARQFVDVPSGLVAVDGRRHVSPHLGPVLWILAVDQHGDARVAGPAAGPASARAYISWIFASLSACRS
jgi:hypothetical protein